MTRKDEKYSPARYSLRPTRQPPLHDGPSEVHTMVRPLQPVASEREAPNGAGARGAAGGRGQPPASSHYYHRPQRQ